MNKEFNNEDCLLYITEADEFAGMDIVVNKFVGVYNDGIVSGMHNGKIIEFPLVGYLDISDCFEKVIN